MTGLRDLRSRRLGRRSPGFETCTTSPTTGPSTPGWCGSPSTGPRSATPSGPPPSTSCTGCSTTPARAPTSAACCSPATARRPRTAGGRSAPVATSASAARTATATPRASTWRTRRIDPARSGRLHILEVQRLIRFMPKVVICRGARLGRRWRPQPARGVRPHPRQPRARPLQADRRRRGQLRRWLRLGLPGPPGRPEVRPGDLLPRRRVLRRGRPPHGHGQRGGRPRRPRGRRPSSGAARSWARARPPSACSSSPST